MKTLPVNHYIPSGLTPRVAQLIERIDGLDNETRQEKTTVPKSRCTTSQSNSDASRSRRQSIAPSPAWIKTTLLP